MRTRLLFATALLASAFVIMLFPGAAAAAPNGPTCGPYMTLTPPWGAAGDTISVNLFHFPANDEVEVIARVTGNPVVGTGTTDEYGRANIMVTVPSFDGDRVAFFAQASPCYAAGAYFEKGTLSTPPPRTPAPATETPTAPATPPTSPTTVVPPVTITPQPPIAGGAGDAASSVLGGGMNLALVGLAMVIFCGAFALWGSTRRLQAERSQDRD